MMGVNEQRLAIAKRLVVLPEDKQQVFRKTLEDKGINSWELPIVEHPDQRIPLSSSQRRLWFIESIEEGSTKYNMHTILDLKGSLDITDFEHAFTLLVERHHILKTTFHQDEYGAYQKVENNLKPSFGTSHWSPERESATLISKLAFTPFNLSEESLIRLQLFKVKPQHYKLLIVIHHIAFDDQSVDILIDDLSRLYRYVIQKKKGVTLAALNTQYSDFAIWQNKWEKSNNYNKQAAFWKEKLSGFTTP